MYRVVAHGFGQPTKVLKYEVYDPNDLAQNDLRVRMIASPVNPSDLIAVSGAYASRTDLPFVPGFEGVGIVDAVGAGVDPTLLGRRVLPLGSAGGWQTARSLPARWCVDVPPDFRDEEAAVAYINQLTALLMVRTVAPAPGDIVGVTGGASAIARMLLRMLAARGARPIAIVRSESSRWKLRDEPAEVMLESARLPSLSAGFDCVGGRVAADLARSIRPGGRLLHYGLLSRQPIDSLTFRDRGIQLTNFHLREWVHSVTKSELLLAMNDVFDEIRAGRAACQIAQQFPLSDFRQALEHDAGAGRCGKILLRP